LFPVVISTVFVDAVVELDEDGDVVTGELAAADVDGPVTTLLADDTVVCGAAEVVAAVVWGEGGNKPIGRVTPGSRGIGLPSW
jgi:hypothetical protein